MDSKVTYVAMGVVVLVLAIGIAFVALSDDNGNDAADDMTFLIQDDDGVYFWAFGEGATVIDAFKDAVERNDMPFTPSKNKEGADDGIEELFGLKMDQVGADWFWWTQYTWTDNAWTQSQLMMNNYTPEDAGHYVACVYGDGKLDPKTLAEPKDAVVWDHNTDGMVFTIQNGENLYFQINGEGDTAMKAFANACAEFKIDHQFTGGEEKPTGVDWLFNENLNMKTHSATDYTYWTQYYKNTGDAEWGFGDLTMDNMPSDKYDECLVKYAFFSFKS